MPLIDGISRRQLQRAALDTLIAANTLAADRVFEPRDWPTRPELFPMLLVQTPRERKTGMMPGLMEFNTTITLAVVGRVWAATPDEANDFLDTLSGQIEEALMLTPSFALGIQQFVSIETQSAVNAESRSQIGELGMVFDLAVYQAFGPSGPPLIGVTGTIPAEGSGPPIIIKT